MVALNADGKAFPQIRCRKVKRSLKKLTSEIWYREWWSLTPYESGTNVQGNEVQEEERQILVSEVKKAIKKLKKTKAAGLDGIPNEAWIYGRN